jgi:hypothetical protein
LDVLLLLLRGIMLVETLCTIDGMFSEGMRYCGLTRCEDAITCVRFLFWYCAAIMCSRDRVFLLGKAFSMDLFFLLMADLFPSSLMI